MLWLYVTPLMCTALIIRDNICDATHLDTKRHFSKSFDGFRELVTFHGVTIQTCEDHCFRRKRCKGALYDRRAAKCTLTDVPRSDQILKENKGTVFVVGFHRLQQTISNPVCTSCAQDETCISMEDDHICKITECGAPPSIYHDKYQGNMFSVNHTMIVHWEGSKSVITCGEDGAWAAVDTQCLPGWVSFESSCYFFDTNDRTHGGAKSFCEHLLPGSHLADLKTIEEAEFVREWLLQNAGDRDVWIDGEYNTADGLYYFSDGTPFSNWSWWPGEPNSLDEHCVAAFHSLSYYSVDIGCRQLLACLCKK